MNRARIIEGLRAAIAAAKTPDARQKLQHMLDYQIELDTNESQIAATGGLPTLLALVEAGTIKEDDDLLAIMQNVSLENAHTIGRWLALATNTEAILRWTTVGHAEEIRYTPDQVRAEIQQQPRQ